MEYLVLREASGGEVSPDAVPRVLELCLAEIEARGLTEQGICKSILLYHGLKLNTRQTAWEAQLRKSTRFGKL